jgi:hypothetical protein
MTTLEILRAVIVSYSAQSALVEKLLDLRLDQTAEIEATKAELAAEKSKVLDLVAMDAEAQSLAMELELNIEALSAKVAAAVPPTPVEEPTEPVEPPTE